jgi:uncharacterized repeat protein (TIGR01451 family)
MQRYPRFAASAVGASKALLRNGFRRSPTLAIASVLAVAFLVLSALLLVLRPGLIEDGLMRDGVHPGDGGLIEQMDYRESLRRDEVASGARRIVRASWQEVTRKALPAELWRYEGQDRMAQQVLAPGWGRAHSSPAPRAGAALPSSGPDVSATKTADAARVSPGGTIEYIVVISNTGTEDALDVVYTAPLDHGTELVPGSIEYSMGGVESVDGAPTTALIVATATGFYFLRPMVPDPGPFNGSFDPGRSPVAQICQLNAGRNNCTSTIIRTFDGGSGSEALKADLTTESYNATWGQAALDLSGGSKAKYYRLVVRDAGIQLGFADLWVVGRQQDLTNVPAGYVGVVRNSPFQIRFRIENAAVGSAPVAAADPGYATASATLLAVPAPGVLANDDLGSPAATLTHFGGGSLGGSVLDHVAGSPVTFGTGGSLSVAADGGFDFTPAAGFSGDFTVEYRIGNAHGTSTATVTIVVGSASVAPAAQDDVFTVVVGVQLLGDLTADNGGGSDALGTPAATVVSFGAGSLGGTVGSNPTTPPSNSVSLAGGTLTVDAAGTFSLTATTATGPFTFLYRLQNTAGQSDATVTIEITAAPPPPVGPTAVDDEPVANSAPGAAFHTAFNTALNSASHATPSLLANDALGFPEAALTFFGGGSLNGAVGDHAAGSTAVAGGHSLTVNGDGSFSYTPATGFTGYFSFEYRIENTAGSDDATVTIAVGQRAVATDDTYPFTLVGNVPINTATSSGFSVLANDTHAGATMALVTASNGTATLDLATGTFAFVPALGHEGPAGFTYSLTNGFGTVTADVSLTVSGMIWFIDNTAEAGSGALGSPFNSVAAFNSANDGTGNNPAGGDHAFIYESAASYTGPLVLLNGQKVIGQDATSSLSALSGLTPPADSPPLPATNSGNALLVNIVSAGNGITLAQNNAIHGLRVGNTTGTGIAGASVGTLAVSDVTVNTTGPALSLANGTLNAAFTGVSSSGGASNVSLTGLGGTIDLGVGALSGSSGVAFVVTGGNATVSYAGTISNAANRVVSINGRTGGVLTLSGPIIDTGAGILVQNNTGGTVAFTGSSKSLTTGTVAAVTLASNGGSTVNFQGGGLAIATTSGAGFSATGGGTVQVTGANNVIASGTGTALRVENTNIGATGLTFRSISANGGANGIVLNDTGTSGGLVVTGSTSGLCGGASNPSDTATAPDAADCSGGWIRNTTGANAAVAGNGIYLSNTGAVSLTRMRLSDHTNHAIRGLNVTGFSLASSYILGVNGNDVASREGSISFENLMGSAAITNSYVDGGAEDNIRVHNGFPTPATAALNRLTISGTTVGHNGTTGNAGVNIAGFGSSVMNATVQSSRFTGSRNNNIAYIINENAAGDVVISGNRLTNNHPNKLGSDFGIYVAHASSGAVTYQVSNNSVNGAGGSGIEVDRGAGGTGPMTGSITGNTVGTSGVANSGSAAGSGIFVAIVGTGSTATHTTTVANNTVRQFTNFGIYVYNSGTGSNYLNATVQNNNVAEPSPNSVAQDFPTSGFRILNGTATGHDGRMCLTLTGNIVNQTATSISHEVRVWGRFASRTAIPGLQGDASAYLAALNTITPAAGSLGAVNASSTNAFQSTCPPTVAASSLTGTPEMVASAGAVPLDVANGVSLGDGELALVNTAWPGATAPLAVENEHLVALEVDEAGGDLAHAQAAIDALEVVASAEHSRWQASLSTTRGEEVVANSTAPGPADVVGTLATEMRMPEALGAQVPLLDDGPCDALGLLASADFETYLLIAAEVVAGRDGDVMLALPIVLTSADEESPPAPDARIELDAMSEPDVTVSIGTLPAGRSVTIRFAVTVTGSISDTGVSTQGMVSGSNFAAVLTDDPSVAGAADPTVTQIGHDVGGDRTGRFGDVGEELPHELTLEAPYPNPFQASTTLRYGLPENARVTITVYDVVGREVSVLVDGESAAGWHQVSLDGTAFANGVYIVHFSVGTDFHQTRRVTLMR